MSTTKTKYTLQDVGCYVDGSRGIHALGAIVEFVQSHGAEPYDSPAVRVEFGDELEDECDDYMNTHYSVDGAFWGRSEQGDWGLWAIEENE